MCTNEAYAPYLTDQIKVIKYRGEGPNQHFHWGNVEWVPGN